MAFLSACLNQGPQHTTGEELLELLDKWQLQCQVKARARADGLKQPAALSGTL
jgi:hypothetical protein